MGRWRWWQRYVHFLRCHFDWFGSGRGGEKGRTTNEFCSLKYILFIIYLVNLSKALTSVSPFVQVELSCKRINAYDSELPNP